MGDMKRELKGGNVWLDCSLCGKMYLAIEAGTDPSIQTILESCYETDSVRHCKACCAVIEHERAQREAEIRRQDYLARIPKLITAAGIPSLYRYHRETGLVLRTPPVPVMFQWLWNHRASNLLLSGETGTGKSTSACFAAMKLIAAGKRVRYCKLRKLLSEWRDARTSEERFADEKFFRTIQKLDVFILDEVVGKTKNTESGQEMMYELLDMISDGEMQTKLWLLGNFKRGSIVELFGEDEPVRRRIEENFLCVGANAQSVEIFHVWQGKNNGE